MPLHHIQPSFAGGEFAPTLHHRVDLQRYATGLKTCRNCFIHVHGGASNRAGFRFIASAKYADRQARLVRFEFSVTQAYIIEIGHQYMRFYKDGGQIIKSSASDWATLQTYHVGDYVNGPDGLMYYCLIQHVSGTFQIDLDNHAWVQQSIYEIPTAFTEQEVPDLRFTQSGDVLYIAHPNHTPQTLTRFDHDNWQMADYAFSAGPFMLSNVTANKLRMTDATHLVADTALFDAGHVGAFFRLTHNVADQTVRDVFTAQPQTGTSLRAGSTWRFFSTGTWTGQIVIQKSTDNGATWQVIRQINYNVDTSGDTGEEQCLIRAAVLATSGGPTPGTPPTFSGSATVDLSADPSTWNGIVKVTTVTDSTHAVVTMTQQVAFRSDDSSTANQAKAPTDDWAEGSWSTYRGFPSTVAFTYDRLFWGSTKTEPQTLWASETGNYASFARHQPLLDSDGVTIQLASQSVNAVRHLVALSDLLAITSTEDWAIRGSDGTFTPKTAQAKTQGYRGASPVAPVIIGNRVILVEPKGRVVRDIGFDFSVDGYTGENISVMSNHLFLNHNITDMAYAQEPDSLVWLVRDDGMLISLTYLREQEVLAWARHDTDGKFEGVETIPGPSIDEVWVIVKRSGARTVERLDPRMDSTDPDDQFFLDSGLSYDNPVSIFDISNALPAVFTADAHGFSNGDIIELRKCGGMESLNHKRYTVFGTTSNTFKLQDDDGNEVNTINLGDYDSGGEARLVVSSVTGLDHLEGKTVSVLANGVVEAQKEVVNGSITLDNPASTVHVGLPYLSEIETLNLEVSQQDGTMQGRKVKINSVVIFVEQSLGCKLSPSDGSYEDEFLLRPLDGSVIGQQMELQTAQKEQDFQGGWEDSGNIRIVQRDPLPMTIVGIIPRLVPGVG